MPTVVLDSQEYMGRIAAISSGIAEHLQRVLLLDDDAREAP